MLKIFCSKFTKNFLIIFIVLLIFYRPFPYNTTEQLRNDGMTEGLGI